MVNSEQPDVAVIVPTRDRRHLLPRALDSVFAQTHANFELIVVDDCSSDDTSSYLGAIADRRLKWHRFGEWRGGNVARNFAVELSRAPILSFLDSDDYLLPNRLERVIDYFSLHKEIDILLSSYASISGNTRTTHSNPEAIFSRDQLERYLIGYCLFLGGSGISVRRQAFIEIGGFDPTLMRMQDRDFLLRAARTRGCGSVADIDWIKSRTEGSLSLQREGKLSSLGELSLRHLVMRERYAQLLHYLVAREIMGPFVQAKLGLVIKAISEASHSPGLDFAPLSIFYDYYRGKRLRKELRREIGRLKSYRC